MNEHTDDVVSNVKESISSDEIVTKRGKIEGIFDDDLVENSVMSLEKVEVVKEVVKENCDYQKFGNGSGSVVEDSRMDCEPSKMSSEEVEVGGGEIEVTEVSESVRIVADGDHVVEEKTEKEIEVLSSVKIAESIEGDVVAVAVGEGLSNIDKEEDGVNTQRLLTEAVGRGTGEDGVDQTNKESSQSTVEGVKNGESMNAEPRDSMDEEDCVMHEETVKDEVLVADEIAENLDQKAEVDQTSKEVRIDDDLKFEDSNMDDEPQVIEGKIGVEDKKEDQERGFTRETVEQPTGSVQEMAGVDHVMDEKTVKDSVSVEPSLVVNAGTGEVDQKVEAAACSKVDEVTTANKKLNSHVRDFTDGANLVENQSMNDDAHMVRGEDAGMDVDEVLGWKDEIPSVQEDDQTVEPTSLSNVKKRKALDSISQGSDKRPHTETVKTKLSFKVGSFIQKVASQPTRPTLKGESADHISGNTEMRNQEDMISQLHLAAQDPMKEYSFVNTIIPFFKSHRAAILSKSRLNSSDEGRKTKSPNENEPDEFEFDDVNDSYWTDRIIQNHPEEQVLKENPSGVEHQILAYEQEKQPPVKPTRRSNKKRFFTSNHEIEANEQSEVIARRQQNLATEVLMKFAGGIYFPSEIQLNKMFRRFGPLMESETEVDRQSGRARLVFKKCSDAEVAHSSAGKFNIFGSISVNYELNYIPLISYKPLPLPSTQDSGHAC